MKKESFVNKISIYIGVTLVLLIWLLTAYTVSSFLLLKESEESSVWSTIQIYMKQIDSKFIAMDQCVEGIAGNQDLIGQICYGSPADRYYAAVELQKSMKRDVISNAELDYVLIAESLNKNLIAASTPGVFGEKEINCLLYLESHGKERPGKAANGNYTKIGTHAYIAKIYREATGVWRHFQRKILFFPISGQKNIQTVRVFFLRTQMVYAWKIWKKETACIWENFGNRDSGRMIIKSG